MTTVANTPVVNVHLLPHEIAAITGYKRKSKQCAWLKAQKIEFRPNAFGHPIVARSYWERVNGQTKKKPAAATWVAPAWLKT